MTPELLFAVGTLLTWFGYGTALRALYLSLKRQFAPAALAAGLAGLSLLIGSEITATKGFHIPLVWFVMPFAAWAFAVCLLATIVRASQAGGSLNPDEGRAKLKAAGLWLLATLAFAWLYRIDPTAKIETVKGSLPVSGQTLLSLVLLACVTVAVMVFTARAAKARGIAKAAVSHLALIVGSVLFGVPFVWLVITSFKEDIDMSSPNGIVWVPRVQETVPYFNKTNPLYEARCLGVQVQGRISQRRLDGTVTLDVNKPMSMRGMTVETKADALREIPMEAKLVTAKIDGQEAEAKVIEELEDGHVRVEAMSPDSVKGRQQIFAPTEVTPIRKVGLRTQNYSDALDYLPPEANRGLTYVRNTVLIVVLALIGTVLSSAIVAYAFSRMRFPGRDVMFTVMLATMMLPGAVTKLPQFMIFKQLGWIDTLYPLWVPAFLGSAFNIFMLRQFFRQIPMELEDAAKIDGAGYFRTFWSVMMPQIQPAIAVIAILTFVGTWNSFLDPLIYINSPENMTISYAVQLYAADRVSEPGLLTAFTTMAMLPVLALFFFAQRYFIEGVTLTGMGGR